MRAEAPHWARFADAGEDGKADAIYAAVAEWTLGIDEGRGKSLGLRLADVLAKAGDDTGSWVIAAPARGFVDRTRDRLYLLDQMGSTRIAVPIAPSSEDHS